MNLQARHILALINIPLWASRHAHTQQVRGGVDRFGVSMPADDTTIDDVPTATTAIKATHPVATKSKSPQAQTTPKTLSTPPIITPVAIPPAAYETDGITASTDHSSENDKNDDTQPAIAQSLPADGRFHLQGVRMGGWVLVVDVYAMSDEEIQMWHALTHALATHAHTRPSMLYHTHEVIYPLVIDDYAEHQSLSPAHGVFVGFMFALTSRGVDVHAGQPKVVFLSAIPQGLHHSNDAKLPTLIDMLANPILKKSLWSAITVS